MKFKPRQLTPELIDRARDLIQLGALWFRDGDEILELCGLAWKAYTPVHPKSDAAVLEWKDDPLPDLVAVKARIDKHQKFDHKGEPRAEPLPRELCIDAKGVWVDAHPAARKRFYNSQGGVDKCWWGQAKNFAKYMRGEEKLAAKTE